MSLTGKLTRAAAGVLVLFVLLLMVSNWWGDYRSASGGDDGEPAANESTATPDATGTPSPESNGEGSGETSPADAPAGKTVVVLVDGLNFRTTASRDGELIRGLDADERLTLLGEESGWLKVRDSAGVEGFVSASSQYTRTE